jgi:hypothetical protein
MAPPLKQISEHMKNYNISLNGCWIFCGNKDKDGYGIFTHGRGKQLRAHRASYEFHKKQDATGKLVCHSCDNPSCINPDHLFLGSPKDNTQDMIKKGRKASCQGSEHPFAKLNEVDILFIKQERSFGKKLKDIANDYGITFQTVSDICRGKTWKHMN